LKLKRYFQLWRNYFIHLSRCALIQSVFAARRNARTLSCVFRSLQGLRLTPAFSSKMITFTQDVSFLVSRHALNRQFFFASNVFCAWRRAVRQMRSLFRAQSRAFMMRPMLLQWHSIAAQSRPSPFPTRAMHFSDLLRAQSVSRQILLQPSTLLALRKQAQDETALSHPYWSQPLQSSHSVPAAVSATKSKLPQPHVITATTNSPSRSPLERQSQKLARVAVPTRPPWVPANVAVTAMAESKWHTGPR